MNSEIPSKIIVVDDGSYRSIQVREVAKYLDTASLATEKRIILTCGLAVVDEAISQKTAGDVLVSIGNPGKDYDKFDLIFVPKHDPHPKLENIKTTTGIINHISPEFLKEVREGYTPLKKPIITVLIGGRHVGGNFTADDAFKLTNILNKFGDSVLLTTSRRTEEKAVKIFKSQLTVPCRIFDYNKDGQAANPYYQWLGWADKVVVTADSVRMCSEACSSGKQVFIFSPERMHFSYAQLRDSLIKSNAAFDIGNLQTTKATQCLNEAERVAKIIAGFKG